MYFVLLCGAFFLFSRHFHSFFTAQVYFKGLGLLVCIVRGCVPADAYRSAIKVRHLRSCSQLAGKGRQCRQKHNQRKTTDKREKEAESEKMSAGREGGTNEVKDRQRDRGRRGSTSRCSSRARSCVTLACDFIQGRSQPSLPFTSSLPLFFPHSVTSMLWSDHIAISNRENLH